MFKQKPRFRIRFVAEGKTVRVLLEERSIGAFLFKQYFRVEGEAVSVSNPNFETAVANSVKTLEASIAMRERAEFKARDLTVLQLQDSWD